MIKIKNKIKELMIIIGILGVLLGRILNSVLSRYVGDSSSNIILSVVLTIFLCVILFLIISKYYIIAILLVAISSPIIIANIGLLFKNKWLEGVGILLFFILLLFMPKFIKKLKCNGKL